ncbi:MAG: 1-pyrroline-5-carboxylate dehydrogenase, partial [Cryomorphaceae bacterium]
MPNGVYQIPYPTNEPIFDYAPGSDERKKLQAALDRMLNQEPVNVPMYIGSEEIFTDKNKDLTPPFDHKRKVGQANFGEKKHVQQAIDAALAARKEWAELPWEQRAAIFLKAADLLAGPYRYEMNAATMVAQSKNAYQSEIDSVCELIDFL